MGDDSHYGDYTGHGVDKVEDVNNIGWLHDNEHNLQHKKNAVDSLGKEKSILNAGEHNQRSDKASNAGGEANWVNRTGQAAKMATAAASGNLVSLAKNIKNNGGLASSVRTFAPVGLIIIVLIMCIAVSFGGQSAALVHAVNNLQRRDPTEIASKVRSKVLIAGILKGVNTKGGPWSKFSDYMKLKFSQSGIEVKSNGDTEGLMYENAAGNKVLVTGDNFDSEYDTSSEFFNAYTTGTKAYGSGMATSYGNAAEKTYEDWQVRRNTYDLEKNKANDFETAKQNFDTESEELLDNATHKMVAEMEGAETEEKKKINQFGETELDEDGNPVMEETFDTDVKRIELDSPDSLEDEMGRAAIASLGGAAAAEGAADGTINVKDFNLFGKAANGLCQVYNVASTINRMLKFYEAKQVITMAMRIMEGVQRMQAGDGGMDVVVDILGNYAVAEIAKVLKIGSGSEVEVVGSMLSSTPMAAVFGGTKLTGEDPIVKSFVTSQSQFSQIMGNIDGGSAYKTCTNTKIVSGLIDSVADVVSFGSTELLGVLTNIAISASVAFVVGAILDVMIPKVANAMTRDFSTFMMGPEASAVLMWGAELALAGIALYMAMQPANPQTLLAHVRMKQEVLADQARYDRNTLSPFDTSSEYTFMGALTRSFNRVSLNTQSVVGKVGALTSVVGRSLISLTPASHATGVAEEIISEGDCPEINDLNGDNKYATAFCTPHFVSDFSTMWMSAEDVMKEIARLTPSVFRDYDPVKNPNPPIRTDNDNFIARCIDEYSNRDAELGYPDPRIKAKYNLSTGSSVIDAGIGVVPLGGIVDSLNGIDELIHMKRILASEYTEDTFENHLCERYIGDQEYGVAMGIYEQSQVAVYLENYNKEHPKDNTPLGVMARRTGQTNEEALSMLKKMNALIFIANYNPEGLGPLFYEEPKVELVIESTEEKVTIIGANYNDICVDGRKDQTITA